MKSHFAGHSYFDDLKKRTINAMEWFGGFAIVVVLYAIMLIALYRWSVYSPIFPPQDGAAAEEALPWP
jgi:hypothetical protein